MLQCTTTQDVLVKLEQAVERGDVPYLHALLNDVEERRQGVQRAGRHHDDVDAVLRGAGRRRAVERRRQGALFGRSLDSFALFQGATRAPQTSLARSANIRDVPARGLM